MYTFNREAAFSYATRWAYERNPQFYDFSSLGGDCTNFASQCLYTGCGVMNYTPETGWYYIDLGNRAPAWTGVPFLYSFLTTNEGPGPIAQLSPLYMAEAGDIIQLQNQSGRLYHSLVVLANTGNDILVASHSDDALFRPLSTYNYNNAYLLHILGYNL